jgi:hypothetical protein
MYMPLYITSLMFEHLTLSCAENLMPVTTKEGVTTDFLTPESQRGFKTLK